MSPQLFSKDGLELPLKLLLTLQDIPIFLIRKRINPLSLYKLSETPPQMKNLKSPVKIMMEFSEKILNGLLMDLEPPPLSMLSISEFLDIICIIPKLTLIPLSSELSEFTILSPLPEELLIVSLSKMTKPITGLYVPLTEPPPPIGSAPFLKFSDSPVPKLVKKKPSSKKFWLHNPCSLSPFLLLIAPEIGTITSTDPIGFVNVTKEENNLPSTYLTPLVYPPLKLTLNSTIDQLKKPMS